MGQIQETKYRFQELSLTQEKPISTKVGLLNDNKQT